MNIPNTLTITRIFLIPIFVFTFFSNNPNSLLYSILIYVIAGITDVVDGTIARKYDLITKLGTILDPLADKLMLITVLSCFVVKQYIPNWILVIVLIKEFLMITGGIHLYTDDIVVSSNIFGKMATFMFHLSIVIFLFNRTLAVYLLYASVFATVVAFIMYSINYHNKKKLLKN